MRTAARWSLMASMLNSAAARNNRDRLGAAGAGGGPRHRDIRARRDIRADQDAKSGMERAAGYRRKGGCRRTTAEMARHNRHDGRSFLHARRSEIAYHRFCPTDPSL